MPSQVTWTRKMKIQRVFKLLQSKIMEGAKETDSHLMLRLNLHSAAVWLTCNDNNTHVAVQLPNGVRLFVNPWTAAQQASLSSTVSWSLLKFMSKIPRKSESEVAQSCPTLCDPMDCSPPGSSIHGIFQAKILEWVNAGLLCSLKRNYGRD